MNDTVRANNDLGDPFLPSVSVIVVGFNSRRYLSACFNALANICYPGKTELLFVDNQSSDGSAAFVASAFPQVRTVETGANLGYAAGNNYGAAIAKGEILVFLNPDTEVAVDWLAPLVRPLVDDPTIGLTTSKILLLRNRETINACGNDISLAGITWCRGAGQPATSFTVDEDVPAVSGCSFAMCADLFRRLDGFDERFFMYLEDTDLSWRARVAGYRCRFVANSLVYHDYRLGFSAWKMGLIERNRYRMLGKHLSLRGIIALSPALVAAEVLTWGYAVLCGPRCILAKTRASLWAVTQLGPVIRTRWRPVEGEMLREHRLAPPVVEGMGGSAACRAQSVISVVSRVVATISLRLLPRSSTRWRPAGHHGWTAIELEQERVISGPDASALAGSGRHRDRPDSSPQ
jgi:GT2 family glycosyltransferase